MPKEVETTEDSSRVDYGIVFSVFMLALIGLMSIYVERHMIHQVRVQLEPLLCKLHGT